VKCWSKEREALMKNALWDANIAFFEKRKPKKKKIRAPDFWRGNGVEHTPALLIARKPRKKVILVS